MSFKVTLQQCCRENAVTACAAEKRYKAFEQMTDGCQVSIGTSISLILSLLLWQCKHGMETKREKVLQCEKNTETLKERGNERTNERTVRKEREH